MIVFLRHLMSPSDRCSVVAFNERYIPLVNLGDEARALAALVAVQEYCQSGTALWDAIFGSVAQFISTADQRRPWILVVLTDGDDTSSTIATIDQTSRVLSAFNAPQNNFTFVIGLGREVNARSLQWLCRQSSSVYLAAEDTAMLHTLFALIALQVVEGVTIDLAAVQTSGVEALFARVERSRQIRRQPIDLLLLVDISGSMAVQ